MKSLLSYLLFFGLILGVYSAVFYEQQHPKSGHEGQCYDAEEDKYYNEGEEMKWNFKICGRKLCRGSTGKGSSYVEMQTCGKVNIEPGCLLDSRVDLPYPDCCQKVICPTAVNPDKLVSETINLNFD